MTPSSFIPRRRAVLGALAGIGAACLIPIPGSAAQSSTASEAAAAKSDPVHDFDGFFGTWHFSPDAGRTWETNYVMRYTRAS